MNGLTSSAVWRSMLTGVVAVLMLVAAPRPAGAAPAAAPAAATHITIDPDSPGAVFDRVGADSAGGSSRLLRDYPEPRRSQVTLYAYGARGRDGGAVDRRRAAHHDPLRMRLAQRACLGESRARRR